jgi:hypothetical protein
VHERGVRLNIIIKQAAHKKTAETGKQSVKTRKNEKNGEV